MSPTRVSSTRVPPSPVRQPLTPHTDGAPPAPRAEGLLVKLRPAAARAAALGAADPGARLRPLFDGVEAPGAPPAPTPFGVAAADAPVWWIAEPRDGVDTAWDMAHAAVAAQLGVAPGDVLVVEPDLVHDVSRDPMESAAADAEAFGLDCAAPDQDGDKGKARGPDVFAWHLGDDYTQLGRARDAVTFTEPRTRIAHLDTGYHRAHRTRPLHVRTDLERSFVPGDPPGGASDPDNWKLLFDNSGHGTGTLGILAGQGTAQFGGLPIGGAPEAEVVPLRIADSVVLLRTSAFARALRYAREARCDVATMSMGGLPSEAWNDAVDEAYLAGLCIVAAAGNNVKGLPTNNLVYPARYRRVIAACGVMADGRPYDGLAFPAMQGNHGPRSRMGMALSAYTPNIPWPVFGCAEVVRRNGEGTSSATPQIAAAAALWLERYKADLPRNWQRVEAVRWALFSSARKGGDAGKLGNGILRAHDALAVRPNLRRPMAPADRDSFAWFRVITGLGVVSPPAEERMFDLELAQRWLLNPALRALVPDPEDGAPDPRRLREFMEAVIADPGASRALRRQVAARYPTVAGRAVPVEGPAADALPPVLPACDRQPPVPEPAVRRLRVYAMDPSLSAALDTAAINEVTFPVRWEALRRVRRRAAGGPAAAGTVLEGEYLRVDDVDASGRRYDAVDLDAPALLAQDGWAPSEGNAQFHQQMTYAVAMRTIAHFERALGRPVLWRPQPDPADPRRSDAVFTRRLTIQPHALRQANAFYSPKDVALRFGYFEAEPGNPGGLVPGSRVYTCLSHDIVAHETTHAILDGMHRRFNEPTNPDVLALHEGFADIVALLQHFTLGGVLAQQIARTRGDLEAESLLGTLAVQFGQATGRRGGLREAIGTVEGGTWTRVRPDPERLRTTVTPHARGAILVAAVFDAFLAIYRTRTADLFRLATGGTGVLPGGSIHPDLVQRLADEAARSAGHVLTMCIRAVDYLPPVDVTFFEFLRAVITADADLVRDDRHNYRVAFAEAFRRHGIYPLNVDNATDDTVRSLAPDTLRWRGLDADDLADLRQPAVRQAYARVLTTLRRYADGCTYARDRAELFRRTRLARVRLHAQVRRGLDEAPAFARAIGLEPGRSFEVHELRRAVRTSPDGRHVPQVIVALTQQRRIEATASTPAFTFRGGVTLLVDLATGRVEYRIVKHLASTTRRERAANYVREASADPLRALFLAARDEPFAALHALSDAGA